MPAPALKSRTASLWSLPAQRPWRTLAVAGALLLAAMALCSRIEPVPSLKPMFSPNDPAARAMVIMFDEFSAADYLLLLVTAPEGPSGGPVRQLTAFADRLRDAIHADDDLRPMVSTYAYHAEDEARRFVREQIVPNGLYYLSDDQLESLKQRLTTPSIRAQIKRNEAMIAAASPTADALSDMVLQDPLRLHETMFEAMRPLRERFHVTVTDDHDGAFIGRDGRSLLIRIRAARPAGELDFTRAFMPAMREAVELADPGGMSVQYAGGYPIAELSERVIRRDMILSVIWSLVFLQGLFLLVYRKPWNFPLTFVPVAWGIQVAFGVYAVFSPRLTPVVAASGAILAGLGIDYAIHYLSHYHSRRKLGDGPLEAVASSRAIGPALSAACMTSLIGFGAIAAARVPALQDFAVIGSLGLAGALVGALVVLPAMLRLVDRKPEEDLSPLRFQLEPMVRWIGRHSRVCVIGSLVAFAAAVAVMIGALPLQFENDMSTMQPRPSPPLAAQNAIAAQFPGTLESVQVFLEADTPDALLRMAHEVDRRLTSPRLASYGVSAPLSIAMLLPDPAKTEARRRTIRSLDAERIIGDFQQAIEDSAFDPAAYEGYVEFLHKFFRPGAPPDVQGLSGYPQLASTMLPRSLFQAEPEPATMALILVQFSRDFATPEQRGEVVGEIRAAMGEVGGATVTGMDIVADEVKATVRADLPLLLSIAGALVAGWLWLVFRSVKGVLLTLIPPAFCMVVLFAMMEVAGVKLNLVNLIAIPMLAGIGVDDGIFLVSIATRPRPRPRNCRGGLNEMIEEMAASCHAILMTSATTTLAFGSLMFTRTPAIQSLGFVLAVGMIACWLASNLLLMPLLISLEQRSATAAQSREAA